MKLKLRKGHRPTWIQAAVVGFSVLSVGLLAGCGSEAVKPPVADKGPAGSAPGGVSQDDYAKKLQEMKGGGGGGGAAYPGTK